MQIIWSNEASGDVERLFVFLSNENREAAMRALDAMENSVNMLADFPEIGRPMNDGTENRELFIPFGSASYVLRYIIEEEKVVIIRAWHSRENREQ